MPVCDPRYDHDSYSVWYYKDAQVPLTMSDELYLVVAENLIQSSSGNVVGEPGTFVAQRGC